MKTNFDPQAQKAIQSARTVARQMKNTFIGTEHLLIGILQTDHSALQKLLSERGITAEQLKEDIQVLFGFNEEETRRPSTRRPSRKFWRNVWLKRLVPHRRSSR